MQSPVVDQSNDHLFAQLIPSLGERPKLASFLEDLDVERAEIEALPDSAFAWPEKRAFPVHTAKHAAASRVYREKCASVPSYVDQALSEACEVFGLDDAMFARPKVAAAPASPDDFLLPDQKKIRVKSAADVKVAEDLLLREFSKLSVENRALACSRLVDKAAAYNVQLAPGIKKLAGFTVTSTQVLKDWLEARSEAAKEASHKDAYRKLASAVKTAGVEITDRKVQIKIASTIDELDKKAGLARFYDRKLPDPMLSVFNTDKIAAAGVMLGGKVVPLDKLAQMPADFYADILGDDFVREASDGSGHIDPLKMAEIIDTLPADMKNQLAMQMSPYLG